MKQILLSNVDLIGIDTPIDAWHDIILAATRIAPGLSIHLGNNTKLSVVFGISDMDDNIIQSVFSELELKRTK